MFDRLSQRLRAYAEKDGRGYPDWAIRYAPLVARARALGVAGRAVLEIGANQNGFSRFSGARTIAIDIAVDHLRAARTAQNTAPVAADAGALPFRDAVFDLVVCVDTFEHLPEPARLRVVREILRVTKPNGASVVTFPSGTAAEKAEQTIRDAYRRYTGGAIRWLEEHAEFGLPGVDPIAAFFRREGGSRRVVRVESNAPLWIWTWTWRVLMCGWPGRANAVFQVALRWSTPLLCRVTFGRGYRAVVWVEPSAK